FTLFIVLENNLLENLLYDDVKELHITYDKDKDTDKLAEELQKVSLETKSTVAQYNFTEINKLMIISANPQKQLKLESGGYPTNNSTKFASNRSGKNNIGRLKIPNNLMEVNLFSFFQLKNVGMGSVFYVKGDLKKFIEVFKNYGHVTVQESIKASILNADDIQLTILLYLVLFFSISLVMLVFTQKKVVAIKKMLGYPLKSMLIASFRNFLPVLSGFLLASTFCIIRFWTVDRTLIVKTILYTTSAVLLLSLVYLLLMGILIQNINIINIIKGFFRGRVALAVLAVLLVLSLTLFFKQSMVTQNNFQKLVKLNLQEENWLQTKKLYTLRITNQLNRNNQQEEKAYLEKAQKFYHNISKKYPTFIVAPYNYVELQKNKANKPIYVGEMRGLTAEEFLTEPGGIDIIIDKNYLERNPIAFVNNNEVDRINTHSNELYVLIPEKYKHLISKIKENYEEATRFYLQEEPPNQEIILKEIKVTPILVKNNQRYFTYSTYYGTEENQNMIVDPIAIIMNPHLMSGLFWGNILTENGGLVIDFEHIGVDEPFNLLQTDIRRENLQNVIISTESVYRNVGDAIFRNKKRFIENSLQLALLIVLLTALNSLFVSGIYTLYLKKVFVKKMLGYSIVEQAMDVIFFPIGLELLTLIVTQYWLGINQLNVVFILYLILLNIICFTVFSKRKTKEFFKESIYDY
ncbi:hypothetical protein MKH57_002580, partial [Enterococcus faecalis]|nr:hypothetical protein [Enterococcus faecalis]